MNARDRRLEDERGMYPAMQVAGVEVDEVVSLAASVPQLPIIALCPYLAEARQLARRTRNVCVEALKITHDVQCSQRALPALGTGENTIRFSAGPSEGTVTIEGTSHPDHKKLNAIAMDFHPEIKDIGEQYFQVKADGASVTFPIATPGEMTRLRFGGHYRLRDPKDQWQMQVSFDDGKTFKTVDTQTGPYQGICKYITVSDIPAGTKAAQVRWVGQVRNTTCLFLVRIDADYKQPAGGFKPVQVTYTWEEGGIEQKDVHVAKTPEDTWKIKCAGAPKMKGITLELAK